MESLNGENLAPRSKPKEKQENQIFGRKKTIFPSPFSCSSISVCCGHHTPDSLHFRLLTEMNSWRSWGISPHPAVLWGGIWGWRILDGTHRLPGLALHSPDRCHLCVLPAVTQNGGGLVFLLLSNGKSTWLQWNLGNFLLLFCINLLTVNGLCPPRERVNINYWDRD